MRTNSIPIITCARYHDPWFRTEGMWYGAFFKLHLPVLQRENYTLCNTKSRPDRVRNHLNRATTPCLELCFLSLSIPDYYNRLLYYIIPIKFTNWAQIRVNRLQMANSKCIFDYCLCVCEILGKRSKQNCCGNLRRIAHAEYAEEPFDGKEKNGRSDLCQRDASGKALNGDIRKWHEFRFCARA